MIQYFPLRKLTKNPYSNSTISFLILLILTSCASVKQIAIEKDASRLLNQSPIFSSHFTGFSIYDIELNQFIASHNSTLKFTPASNTKLLTAYTTLRTFSDSIPSLALQGIDSGFIVSPLGDPSFLYSPFKNQTVFEKLKSAKKILIHLPESEVSPYGSGWAWDDYIYNYQPQRSLWPIYGNTVSIKKAGDTLTITPPFFKDYVEILKQQRPGELIDRELKFNLFKAYLESDTSDFERIIPFEYSNELLLQLLNDTLANEVNWYDGEAILTDTLYAQHIDSVLVKMLKPSDNFLAEQLLLMSARQSGFDEVKPFIKHIKTTWLAHLSDMVWVDGSGLSRYNLIAPVDQVRLLKNCLDEFGWERMTALLPSGGEGTLKDLYLPLEEEEPFIFAKTGTLSNNHNLSGYLITKSGKRLIFSFMSNHYIRPTTEVKKAMEAFLQEIRNAY
ncbi:D-alanyl-D-alanine carboxypeptidase / D-alanyl-D-alanine-endopeptidase (penicillin-binding protein 4) [Ekhidna lutea]|uniref:D-alanyl-D-alanine carboxypeptidase / D-alanyl-D-alanine-endopeptidase (Penicillin-binding protein 4) n=1 Tax=Ekhidna lutea TaxID=447679 RepID=A0A239LJW1_EKHLU|nr:D-alanyl-D-alanine carboxypeptidase [Ekhidna lutea]SNT30957.1 D-alanyl-D-alanine carboxypeptidase / D-alanyl-D-alanine-endopeptidase (penicillin-binding protein 4) [Ekhidna lutea]